MIDTQLGYYIDQANLMGQSVSIERELVMSAPMDITDGGSRNSLAQRGQGVCFPLMV